MAWVTTLLFLSLLLGTEIGAQGGGTFLMVIGGIKFIGDQNVQTDEVQVISLEPELYPVPECLPDVVNPFPITISDMAGGAVHSGLPHVCGGFQGATSNSNISDLCYRFDQEDLCWQQYGRMTEKKDFVAYDHSSDWGLIISGGYDGEKYFETVENTLDSLNFDSLPDLPKEQYIGCLAIVDEETLFATGGKTNGVGDNETYIYSKMSGEWTRVDDMPTPRYSHACGVVTNPVTGELEVVVAGGGQDYNDDDYGDALDVVEIFSVSDSKWRTAANPLPTSIKWGAVVRQGDAFNLVGGYNREEGNFDTIWTYNALTEDWILHEVSLPTPIRRHVAMMVETTLFKPCE